MSKSIMTNDTSCFVCGLPYPVHKHHIFYGTANRKLSERYGCWVYLCPRHHNMSMYGVHSDTLLDLKLKRMCQETFERHYNVSRERFIEIFGRSYL